MSDRTIDDLRQARHEALDVAAKNAARGRIKIVETPSPHLQQADVCAFLVSETVASFQGYIPLADLLKRVRVWAQQIGRRTVPDSLVVEMLCVGLADSKAIRRLKTSKAKVVPGLSWKAGGRTHV